MAQLLSPPAQLPQFPTDSPLLLAWPGAAVNKVGGFTVPVKLIPVTRVLANIK